MKKELELKLQEKYPKQFRDLYGDEKLTCMSRGLTCSSGWFEIVEQACSRIQEVLDKNPMMDLKWRQIKEKFGQLVLNGQLSCQDKVICNEHVVYDIIKEIQEESLKVCEICGTRDAVNRTWDAWIRSLCEKCRSGPLRSQDS